MQNLWYVRAVEGDERAVLAEDAERAEKAYVGASFLLGDDPKEEFKVLLDGRLGKEKGGRNFIYWSVRA